MTVTPTIEVPFAKFEAGNYQNHAEFGDQISPYDCEWEQDEIFGHQWHTECGLMFKLPEPSPVESNFSYCPGCGGVIFAIPQPPYEYENEEPPV